MVKRKRLCGADYGEAGERHGFKHFLHARKRSVPIIASDGAAPVPPDYERPAFRRELLLRVSCDSRAESSGLVSSSPWTDANAYASCTEQASRAFR